MTNYRCFGGSSQFSAYNVALLHHLVGVGEIPKAHKTCATRSTSCGVHGHTSISQRPKISETKAGIMLVGMTTTLGYTRQGLTVLATRLLSQGKVYSL